MYYLRYEDKNTELVQYKVSVNIEKLRNVAYEIIEHCSFIKHVEGEFRGDQIPRQYTLMDLMRYRNLQKELLRKEPAYLDMEYSEGYYDIYRLSYDEYVFPTIVEKIETILKECENNNTNEIDGKLAESILDYKEERKVNHPVLEIKKKIKKLQENSLEDATSFARNLEEIKQLRESYEKNKYQQPITPYLDKVKDCFLLEPHCSIHVVTLINSYPFLDPEVKEKLDRVLTPSTVHLLNKEYKTEEVPKQFDKKKNE